MKEIFLIKLGEMVLKGQNRNVFDQTLLKNIKNSLLAAGDFQVKYAQSTVYVIPKNEDCDMALAEEKISKIFGIIAYTKAAVAEKDFDDIARVTLEYLGEKLKNAKTFKVESRRSDKNFPLKSPELSAELGGKILSRYHH